jgi:hypothetical protein
MVRALGLGVPCGYIDLTTCEHLSTFWTSTLVAKYRWTFGDPHGFEDARSGPSRRSREMGPGVVYYLPSLKDVPMA